MMNLTMINLPHNEFTENLVKAYNAFLSILLKLKKNLKKKNLILKRSDLQLNTITWSSFLEDTGKVKRIWDVERTPDFHYWFWIK